MMKTNAKSDSVHSYSIVFMCYMISQILSYNDLLSFNLMYIIGVTLFIFFYMSSRYVILLIYVPWQFTSSWLPSVLEIQLVRSSIFLAVKLFSDEGTT